MAKKHKGQVSRRDFLGGTAAGVVGSTALAGQAARAHTPDNTLEFKVNAKNRHVIPHPEATLADVLRDNLELTGTKIGCGVGSCGACAVHVDGKLIRSCTMPAKAAAGASVLTIEGLESADGALHRLQEAFVQEGALQCGFCTPGQIMTGLACIHGGKATSPGAVREFMNENLCRCGAHAEIVAAVLSAASELEN